MDVLRIADINGTTFCQFCTCDIRVTDHDRRRSPGAFAWHGHQSALLDRCPRNVGLFGVSLVDTTLRLVRDPAIWQALLNGLRIGIDYGARLISVPAHRVCAITARIVSDALRLDQSGPGQCRRPGFLSLPAPRLLAGSPNRLAARGPARLPIRRADITFSGRIP